jgi:DNA polymerase I-like protein with 3'-5' exonuclease and polymerase domains
LGNIKVRTPTGQVWVDADKSARDMIERYKIDPKTDCHQELANIIEGRIATKPERDRAKIIFLALSYGMGGAKLCRSLGFPTIMAARDSLTGNIVEASTEEGKRLVSLGSRIYEAAGIEGQSLIDRFDASVPFVKALNKVCQKTANKYGYIRCEDGRKCRFPKDDAGNLLDSHKAMNKRIQGSSAGQTKAAMIQLDKEGFFMTAQIHDEICASVKDHAEAKKIGEIMENTYKLIVPSVVSLECGTSWGEAKEI